ncbi:MAG: hypothetical protein WCF25_02260 [Acidimicrobiales bacterium]
MNKWSNARLLVPSTVVTAGSVIAVAVGIGHTWRGAIVAEAVTLAIATAYYVATGRDSDAGAIYGQRSDERQAAVLMEASRRAFIVMLFAAFVCVVVTVALDVDYWQADVIGSLGALTFLFGLRFLGGPNHRTSGEGRGVMDTTSRAANSRAEDYTNS